MNQLSTLGHHPKRTPTPVVYLVDDEKLLLDLEALALKDIGCVLKKFHDPEAALKAFQSAKTKPVLLITDYAMAKLNGLELIANCKKVRPDLKSILVSGTAGAEIIVNSPVKVDMYLAKPFQPARLAEVASHLIS
jgi:DNA-binding NtrC family response regulator